MKQKQLLNQITLIKLSIKDLNNCIELDQLTLNGMWTQKQWESELNNEERVCLGILKAKKLIGFACGYLVLDEVNITLIGIHPLFQRNGLGSLVINSLFNEAYDFGSRIAILEVKESNYKALSFYRDLGFKQIGYRYKLYKDGISAIVLSKDLFNKNLSRDYALSK